MLRFVLPAKIFLINYLSWTADSSNTRLLEAGSAVLIPFLHVYVTPFEE